MRRFLVVTGVIVVLLALVVVGIGWYYSGKIIDGLTIEGDSEEYPYEVTAVQGDAITYAMPAGDDPLEDHNTDNRVGMAFPDGSYIQLAQEHQVDGSTVTRAFDLLAGDVPQPGMAGQMDWPAYPGPEALDYDWQEITYPSPLGPSPAIILYPDGDTADTWAIVVHGRGAPMRVGLRAAPLLLEQGFPTMLITYRDDLKDPGAHYEDGIGNVGLTEWADLEAAVGYAVDNGAETILLTGYSMGGGIVAAYLEQGAERDRVIGTVLLTPLIDMHEAVEFGAERLGVPGPLIPPLAWVAERIAEFRVNLDFDKIGYIDNAETWPVPAFVTAASEDDLVPPEAVQEFAEHLPDGEFLFFDGANHTGGWNWDSQRFESALSEWLTTNFR